MDILVFIPLSSGLIFALVQVLKQAGFPPQFAALVEVFLGIAFCAGGVLVGAVTLDTADLPVKTQAFWAVIYGLISGLTAAGVYTDKKQIAAPNA